jgi:alpha-glucosidase
MNQIFPIITFFILLNTAGISSQVYIKLESLPQNTPEKSKIYITGNFNGWNPGNENYELKRDSNNFYYFLLTSELKEIEFKFTLGSWEREECNKNGNSVPNRQFSFSDKDSLYIQIEGWKNTLKKHTASINVSILKEDFYMAKLEKKRRICIYLPPDYKTSNSSYPVYYAHDGQNLFDAATSFAGEWGIDECLDSLNKTGMKVPIVVGIDNGGLSRIDELTPWLNDKYGGGKAKLYCDFIVKTLKPYIDSAYRTLPDKKNTGVFGSSLGGLVSFYMAMEYSDIFGRIGVFSPSFWFSDEVFKNAEHFTNKKRLKIYIVAGEKDDVPVSEMLKMQQLLEKNDFSEKNLKTEIISGGNHSEWFWRREFPKVIQWLIK